MTTNKTYPLSRAGFGGAVFYVEDGTARTSVPTAGGVALVTPAGGPTGPNGPWASTEAKDTMAAFGQPPVGTWASTEASDTIKAGGWSQRKPDDAVQTFNTVWSNGNRLISSLDSAGNGLIDSVTTTLGGATQAADFSTAFNGRTFNGGANGPDYGGTPTANVTSVVWHMNQASGQPGALAINGLRFANQDLLSGTQDWGNWSFLGSLDGSTWFEIGSFNLVHTMTGYLDANGNGPGFTINFGGGNIFANIPWVYFSLVWTGGAWATGRLCSGLDFMAFGDKYAEAHSATVTHSSGLTVTGGSPSGTLANYQNGNYEFSFTSDNSNVPTVNGLTNGEYIQFDWGLGKAVAPFRFRVNLKSPGVNYGTCQWSASNDGTTWTNIGSSFTMDMTSQRDPVFAIDNPTRVFYQMWRLTFVSTTQTQLLDFAEVVFDMQSYTFDALNVVEAPDTFSGHGYVGAFGVNGDLAATEAADRFAASGYEADVGTWASTENPDTFSAYGFEPVAGHLTVTEATDKFTAAGIGLGENGTWASTESVDTLTIIGYTPNSGTLAATENPDTARFIGAGVTIARQRRVFIVT